MTDPIAYIEGQLTVFDVIALIEEEVKAEYDRIAREYEEWTRADEEAYLATCPGYLAAAADESTIDDPYADDDGREGGYDTYATYGPEGF